MLSEGLADDGRPGSGFMPLAADCPERVRALAEVMRESDDLVGLVEAAPDHRIRYLNEAAVRAAGRPLSWCQGRRLPEVFPHFSRSPLGTLLREATTTGLLQSARAVEALPGALWNMDAVPAGEGLLLAVARPVRTAVTGKRFEGLLESTEALWRQHDPEGIAATVVAEAARIVPDLDCMLALLEPGQDRLRVVAATDDRLGVGIDLAVEESIAGRALRRGVPVESLVGESSPDLRPLLLQWGARTLRVVPLLSGTTMADGSPALGVLTFVRRLQDSFTDEERRLTADFGRRASLALHRAQLLTDARRDAKRLEVAFQAAIAMASSLSPRAVADQLLARAVDAIGADRATLSSIRGSALTIEATFSRDGKAATWIGHSYEIDRVYRQPLTKRVLETRLPAVGGAYDMNGIADELRDGLASVKYAAALPLLRAGEVIGLLVASRASDPAFTDDDLQTLQLIGHGAMQALRNAALFDELKASNEAKSDFLNMAAHELRTPISVLSGYASMLLDGTLGEVPETWVAPLRIMEAKAKELNSLVEDLLSAARVQRGAAHTNPERLDIRDVVRAAVDRAVPNVRLRGGVLSVDLPAHAVQVDADPVQISRALDNLLSNAIAYSVREPQVVVRVVANNGHVGVEVQDRGRGIPAESREAIFDQFVRIDDPSQAYPPGTGLGLYISRGLARANGGDVKLVYSEPGEGSLFVLQLLSSGTGD